MNQYISTNNNENSLNLDEIKNGDSSLHLSIFEDMSELLEYQKGRCNIVNADGDTLLHLAVRKGNSLLLNYKAGF